MVSFRAYSPNQFLGWDLIVSYSKPAFTCFFSVLTLAIFFSILLLKQGQTTVFSYLHLKYTSVCRKCLLHFIISTWFCQKVRIFIIFWYVFTLTKSFLVFTLTKNPFRRWLLSTHRDLSLSNVNIFTLLLIVESVTGIELMSPFHCTVMRFQQFWSTRNKNLLNLNSQVQTVAYIKANITS